MNRKKPIVPWNCLNLETGKTTMKMTKDEFKSIRENRGYTQAGLGLVLGYAARQIRRFEAGDWPIPPAVEMALRVMPRAKKRKKPKS